ncbi:uncharacterized protein MONOS_4326 [Monocercomonoides exilis]|uniref:uncharacterized protein n=1 Tax=Monocercomonoides exilis TaxID=2049356 RepID=UPI0035594A4B|nr:hypothetical protein MONOS_4326 [Monocercomonoides exilis]|eukprot:MONOS_4326.1-p1 / transcript=MONOS_4326.1 / gene=MONOS_4326 / organism=Monocercomonoides_exilis_PA203 / gene_product=unspecified product / transcript_product=unspecified product / location=Mono_scaffold00113:112430-113767(-) / protein_length=345 / sequence_SO=supercontig / SO=protein_coding / is_pseudo=false
MSATSENTTSEPAKSSEPVVSVEENTVSNQQPASESAAKEVIPAKSKEKEKKKKKEKSPSKLTTSSSDLPEFLQKIEKYVMKKFVSFCFFPFQGINCLIIYLLPQLLWLLAEFICSVVYLANNGLPKGLERQIFLNSGCEKGYFMPAWMLVDSLAGFADLALHMIVMSKPAQVLKADTPSIFSSPFNVITEEKGNAKLMYKIGLLSWTIFRMFSFIWTFIGSVFLAITRYSWNTMSKEGNIIQTMPHRLCFYIRNWQKNPFTKYTIVYPFDIANGDSPVFATPSGLMQFTSFCLMLNWFSLGCTVTIGCFACFVRVVFRHMAGVAAETSAEINANNASPFVESQ